MTNKMTRKEMERIIKFANFRKGYCCYEKDGIKLEELKLIGTNSGVYGWNWNLYYCIKNDCYYVDGYRNY